ncbi:MAG: (2Fe-2S)-binding protein [Myxococcota bacterium]
MKKTIRVNGAREEVDVPEDTPLLWVLRESLGLTGTKFGCGIAQCGACTVQLDGKPVRSCVYPVKLLSEQEVTTIEGLDGPVAEALREEWAALDVPQCGYCQSGQLMTAEAVLRSTSDVDSETIDRAMAGNVCRCATYVRIRGAILKASQRMEG